MRGGGEPEMAPTPCTCATSTPPPPPTRAPARSGGGDFHGAALFCIWVRWAASIGDGVTARARYGECSGRGVQVESLLKIRIQPYQCQLRPHRHVFSRADGRIRLGGGRAVREDNGWRWASPRSAYNGHHSIKILILSYSSHAHNLSPTPLVRHQGDCPARENIAPPLPNRLGHTPSP